MESPLSLAMPGTENLEAAVQISEQALRHYFNLRGPASELTTACTEFLGLTLPINPNTYSGDQDLSLCWLGPDEWMLLAGDSAACSKAWLLLGGLNQNTTAFTELSSGFTTLTLGGSNALELLAKAMIIDLHPRVFFQGCCAQSLCAKADVLIIHRGHQDKDLPTIDLVVRRSFATYLWKWLHDSAQEFKVSPIVE